MESLPDFLSQISLLQQQHLLCHRVASGLQLIDIHARRQISTIPINTMVTGILMPVHWRRHFLSQDVVNDEGYSFSLRQQVLYDGCGVEGIWIAGI